MFHVEREDMAILVCSTWNELSAIAPLVENNEAAA